MRTQTDRRPLKRQELRYVLFHEDQYKNAPDKLKVGAKLHIGRSLTTKGSVIIACTGESHLAHWGTYDAYPFFRWFKEAGAPICGRCERTVMADIEANGLDD